MVHAVSLGLILFVSWLLMSGIFIPFILVLGILSCAVVVAIMMRMDVVDHEAVPVHLKRAPIVYWPWLLWEIVKANIDVSRRVLFPSAGISPTMVRIKATQKTDLGLVTFANSITLTPGTVSMDVADGYILVHALTRAGAESVEEGTMDRRVSRMMGEDR